MAPNTRSKIVVFHTGTDGNRGRLYEELGALQSAASRAQVAAIRYKEQTLSLYSLQRSMKPDSILISSDASSELSNNDSVVQAFWNDADEVTSIPVNSGTIGCGNSKARRICNAPQNTTNQIPLLGSPNDLSTALESPAIDVSSLRPGDNRDLPSLSELADLKSPSKKKGRPPGSKNRNSSSTSQRGDMVFRTVLKKSSEEHHSSPRANIIDTHEAKFNGRNSLGPGSSNRSIKDLEVDAPKIQPIDFLGPPPGPFRRWISPKPISHGGLPQPVVYKSPSIKFRAVAPVASMVSKARITIERSPVLSSELSSIESSGSDDLLRGPGQATRTGASSIVVSDTHYDRIQRRQIQETFRSGQLRFKWPGLSNSPRTAQDLIHHVPSTRTLSIASLLRHRELGLGYWNSSSKASEISAQIRNQISKRLTYWRGWTGVSKDVLTVAWSPNGSMFVVGGSTDLDNLNLQYNRSNNLLLGDIDSNTIKELPDHHIARPRPETIEYGDNSRQAVYDSVDSELYTTITSVSFDTQGDRMYTASYDKTVKIWDVSQKGAHTCLHTLQHDAPVDHLAISKDYPVFATGQMATSSSIRIYDSTQPSLTPITTFSSPRASKLDLYPTGLQLGIAPEVDKLLLAGFMANKGDDSITYREGDLCLWDLESGTALRLNPSAQSVFDICWHPSLPVFAAATTPTSQRNLTDRFRTRSVIRTFRPLQGPGRIMEYECPASDINDIKFHPFDDNYISAGCTDGVTYFYDYRMPDRILHKLRHGPVIDQLDEFRNREEQDTGVRLSLWDQDGQLFYTGSSDGVIKAWNIYGSTEDAFVRDIAHFDSHVMCGAFSPDYNNLLVGLSKGAVQVLSNSPTTHPLDQTDDDLPLNSPYETMTYIPANQPSTIEEPSGIDLSHELIASGKLVMHPTYGAGQGPLYDGPYASYAHPKEEDPSDTSLIPDIRAMQLNKHERKQGLRAGGSVSKEDKKRYRDQKKLAHARNFLWYRVEKPKEVEKSKENEYSEEDEHGEGSDEDKDEGIMNIRREMSEMEERTSRKRSRESESVGISRKKRRRRSSSEDFYFY